MVTQTNLAGKLVEKGLRVALIAPDAEDENLKKYCVDKGIRLFEFRPQSPFWTLQYLNVRRYFLEDIRNNTALWEKHLRSFRTASSRHFLRKIYVQLLYLVYLLVKKIPVLRSWYKSREDKYLVSDEALELIKKIDPKLVVSTYPVNFQEAMLLKAAKRKNRKTIIHLLSWDNITCKGHFPTLADEYIVWGEIMKSEFIEYYNILEEKIHVCGVPHFDLHIESRENPKPQIHLEQLGLNPNKPYLFFGMSSPRFAPKEIDVVEWLATCIEQNVFGIDLQLVIRPHPQNVQGNMADQTWLPRLNAINKGRVAVDFPELVQSQLPWSMQLKDMHRLSNLLAGCLVSMNSGSTLSIDALMCGVPVILTSFDGKENLDYWNSARRLIDYPHLKKLVNLQGVNTVWSFDDLTKEIHGFIDNPSMNMAKRKLTAKLQCANYEIPCTQKVVDTLMSLIQ